MSGAPDGDWFEAPDPESGRPGLRFKCTMCGNCCTGPEGYVLFTPEEGRKLAARIGVSEEVFLRDFTKSTTLGRSFRENRTPFGLDCIFLDRTTIPGKAVCGVYEDRPAQCRTWPFWKSLVKSRRHWDQASRGCPGMNQGKLIPPEQIRILRDKVDM